MEFPEGEGEADQSKLLEHVLSGSGPYPPEVDEVGLSIGCLGLGENLSSQARWILSHTSLLVTSLSASTDGGEGGENVSAAPA